METPVQAPRTRKVFYGWWMVAAGIASSMIYGGLYTYGFSTYFRPLTSEMGWSRTDLSGVISLSRLEGGVISPAIGYLIDRLGPRLTMLAGITIMSIGFVLLSMVQDFLSFTLVYVLVLSVGAGMGTISPVQAALANWFIKKRTLVLGLFFGGFGFGGVVVPITAWVIEQYGWRNAALISAVVLLVTCIPLALVMRQRPEDYGYLPDGDPPRPTGDAAAGSVLPSHREVDFTPKEAIRTRTFWLMGFAWMMWSTLPAVTTVHLIPYFTDLGFGPQLAATIFGVYAVIGGVSRPIMGWIGDKVNKRYLLSAAWFVQVLGLVLLANVHTIADAALFMIIFAPSYGGTIPLRGALQAEYFGRKHFATIGGFIRVLDLVGTVGGPVAVGWAFDNLGGVDGYRLAFLAIGAINLAGAFAILLARPPVLKRMGDTPVA